MWKDKKVLITGINGFIASHLARNLKNKGSIVYGIVLPGKNSDYPLIDCDLTDIHHAVKAVSDLKPDAIFHLGGQSTAVMAKNEPLESFKSNVITTINLLEAVRTGHKSPLVYASTRDVYDSLSSLPYIEDGNLNPKTIYGCTKLLSENLIKAYFLSYGIPAVAVRASNVYGPNDLKFERIIPAVIKSVVSYENVILFGDGSDSRDFIYAEDLAEGYVILAENLLQGKYFGEAFNFSGEKPFPIKEIAEKIIHISGKEIKIEFSPKPNSTPDIRYSSSDKAKKLLQWNPK